MPYKTKYRQILSEDKFVALISQGLTNKQIASNYNLREGEISNYRTITLRKHKVLNTAQLVAHFYETGRLMIKTKTL